MTDQFAAGKTTSQLRILLRRKTINQPRATRGFERVIAAPARGVRCVPRQCRRLGVQTHAVVVAHYCIALAAFGPVAAGSIIRDGKRGAIGL
jgi:hypothetical protein